MFLKNYLDIKKNITMEYVDNKITLNGTLVDKRPDPENPRYVKLIFQEDKVYYK